MSVWADAWEASTRDSRTDSRGGRQGPPIPAPAALQISREAAGKRLRRPPRLLLLVTFTWSPVAGIGWIGDRLISLGVFASATGSLAASRVGRARRLFGGFANFSCALARGGIEFVSSHVLILLFCVAILNPAALPLVCAPNHHCQRAYRSSRRRAACTGSRLRAARERSR